MSKENLATSREKIPRRKLYFVNKKPVQWLMLTIFCVFTGVRDFSLRHFVGTEVDEHPPVPQTHCTERRLACTFQGIGAEYCGSCAIAGDLLLYLQSDQTGAESGRVSNDEESQRFVNKILFSQNSCIWLAIFTHNKCSLCWIRVIDSHKPHLVRQDSSPTRLRLEQQNDSSSTCQANLPAKWTSRLLQRHHS